MPISCTKKMKIHFTLHFFACSNSSAQLSVCATFANHWCHFHIKDKDKSVKNINFWLSKISVQCQTPKVLFASTVLSMT